MTEVLKIECDGGSRGNPGPAAVGVYCEKFSQEVFSISEKIGETTNNVAEYMAFIKSVEKILENPSILKGVDKIEWQLDSKLVVNQLNNLWKIKKPHLQELHLKARELLDQLEVPYSIRFVYRAENHRADLLVNIALDK